MITGAAQLPAVRFTAIRPPSEPLNLRTDIAMFAGRTRRGPLGEAVRVEGWRRFETSFGGISAGDLMSYAVKGYFDNGGDVAWIFRIGAVPIDPASVVWDIGGEAVAAAIGFDASKYRVSASSPGLWGNRVRVTITLQREPAGPQTVDFFVAVDDEPAERLVAVPCRDVRDAVASRSTYIRLAPMTPPPAPALSQAGPLTRRWNLQLESGTAPNVDRNAYDRAVDAAILADEPAVFAFPDLAGDLTSDDQRREIIAAAARGFSAELDRLLLVDLPERIGLATTADAWLSAFGEQDSLARAAAAYHPWIMVDDPKGSIAEPFCRVPPSGHVAGAISRLDRERGAAITPANATLDGAIDLARTLPQPEQAGLHELGVNAIVCQSGRGLVIWGGRMLGGRDDASASATTSFVAHRRLIHRLVRAIRQTARPLVFEVNDPQLWFTLARGVTTILLEAWRARALKGTRPEEAFRVRCDASLNTAEVIDRGQVICEISLAPAVPMEFITLRVALSADGQLEIAEP